LLVLSRFFANRHAGALTPTRSGGFPGALRLAPWSSRLALYRGSADPFGQRRFVHEVS